jgi:hypothetical protein
LNLHTDELSKFRQFDLMHCCGLADNIGRHEYIESITA